MGRTSCGVSVFGDYGVFRGLFVDFVARVVFDCEVWGFFLCDRQPLHCSGRRVFKGEPWCVLGFCGLRRVVMGGLGQVGEVGDSLGLGFFEWMAQVGEIDGGGFGRMDRVQANG